MLDLTMTESNAKDKDNKLFERVKKLSLSSTSVNSLNGDDDDDNAFGTLKQSKCSVKEIRDRFENLRGTICDEIKADFDLIISAGPVINSVTPTVTTVIANIQPKEVC